MWANQLDNWQTWSRYYSLNLLFIFDMQWNSWIQINKNKRKFFSKSCWHLHFSIRCVASMCVCVCIHLSWQTKRQHKLCFKLMNCDRVSCTPRWLYGNGYIIKLLIVRFRWAKYQVEKQRHSCSEYSKFCGWLYSI